MLELRAGDTPEDAAARLSATGLYEFVEPDYLRFRRATPNDPRFAEQWALRNTGQSGGRSGADVSATPAWDTRSSAESVIVAVLDTGLRVTHEDLAGNLWVNPGEIPGNGIDDDGNGYIDDVHGINSLLSKGTAGSGDPFDDQGHGTAVAGVIGAVGNNGKGISGVAWRVQLMPMKIDNREGATGGGAFTSNIIECVDYAIAKGARVINLSYGGNSYSHAEVDAFRRARDHGIIVVISAGNDGNDTSNVPDYPASYPVDNIVSVANSDRNDRLFVSSNYGGLVELAAPGTDILTLGHDRDDEYVPYSGTSFSAPMVAGSLALLRAQFPDDSPRALINRLLRSVDRLPEFEGKVSSGGRLNLARALTASSWRPFNDDFAERSKLVGESVIARGSSAGATAESGEPAIPGGGGASVWWTWTAPRSGQAMVDTDGSAFDTVVAVYSGAALAQLGAPIVSNDDAPGRTTSRATFAVTKDVTYHIAVDGKGGATGFVALNVGMAPLNDGFSAAVLLTGDTDKESGTLLNAGLESGEPIPTGEATGRTVWYRWSAPRTSKFSVNVSSLAFPPVVSVYRGTTLAELQLVKTGADVVSFDTVAGAIYHISVDSASDNSGGFVLNLLEAYAAIPYSYSVSSSVAYRPTENQLAVVDEYGYLASASTTDSWVEKLPGLVDVATPAIGPDGSVHATTSSGLFVYRSNGTLRWEKRFKEGASGSPALAADGTVYVHADNDGLYAFSRSGRQKWRVSIPGASYSSPVLGRDGTVYLGTEGAGIYAIAPTDGAIKWRFATNDDVNASVALGQDDTVYVGDMSGRFYAVSSSGATLWTYTAGGPISSSAALGSDGTVYFGSYDKRVYALTSAGALRWTYSTGDEIRGSSPAVGTGGTIFIGSYDGALHAITSGGSLRQLYQTAGIVRSSPLISEGTVFFAAGDGTIYYLFPREGAAPSWWPMHRQNPLRTGRRMLDTAPVIHTQPVARTVGVGGSTTLTVNADGEAPLSFQWYRDGVPVDGATDSSLVLENASAEAAGSYSVVVTNSKGQVTSNAVRVDVVTASNLGRIINLSARALAGSDAKTLIVGFVVGGGSGPKDLLIRGVGPTLGQSYGVPRALADPELKLYRNGDVLASNGDWQGDPAILAMNSQVGAFAFADVSSKDAALIANVSSGPYSAHITGTGNSGLGVALAEFYDATSVFTASTPRLINISARSEVGRGADVLIAGFVISGGTPCKVLIRAVGPTLADPKYGVPGVLANPRIQVRNQKEELVAENDDWGSGQDAAALETVFSQVGAFSLLPGSKDAALVLTLEPGVYSAVVSGVDDTTGVALAEVYQVD